MKSHLVCIQGYSINSLKQENFNLPNNFHCRLSELYMGSRFIQIDALQDLVQERTGNDEPEVTETSFLALQNSMKYVIGSQKTHDGVKIIFPNFISLLNPKPPKYSSSQTNAKFHKTKKGSSINRKILDRDLDFITASRQKSWRKTTGDCTV
jgi:hypothetical protein